MNQWTAQKTVVLVPYLGAIHPGCEVGLSELERQGYTVRRVGGNAAIDAARSQLATDALRDGFQWLMWIDSDIGFDPPDVERLAQRAEPVVAGLYPKKGCRALACHVMPGTPLITFGQAGGLVEMAFVGAGFLLTIRDVYDAIATACELPICNLQFDRPIVPYFLPLIHTPDSGQPWYLSEDFAFCHRLRQAGYRLWADTTIRLRHFGSYGFTWEDAGASKVEYATYEFHVE
jgi:hypothetical protein